MNSRLGLGFVALAGLGLVCWLLMRPDPQANALRVRRLATRGLAEYLAQKFSGQRALVLSNPFTQSKDIEADVRAAEEAGLKGLREGAGDKLIISAVVFPALRPEAKQDPRALLGQTETTTPLSYLVATNGFDQAFQAHPDAAVLVSLIGLPAELDQCAIWKAAGPPYFALLWPDLRILGDTAEVRQALKTGKLVAFVLRKPGAPADAVPLEADWKVEFEKRLLLVTPENVDATLRGYPGVF
jgi:hypothetical protein